MLNININTTHSVMNELKKRYKDKRLSLDLTQEGLANRSGVSLGSLKRFESSGHISLESLLKISNVLGCLDDFCNVAKANESAPSSIAQLQKREIVKKRGSKK